MLKKITPAILLVVVMVSCSKNDSSGPSGSGGSGGSGAILSAPAKYILISAKEVDPVTTKDMLTLRCYNPDMTLRWKKTNLGTIAAGLASISSVMPGVTYGNNAVYFIADSVFSIGVNYYTYSLFFAFDINTGNMLWQRRGTTDNIQNPVVRNDTIYCNYQSSTGANYVAAYNPNTGAEFWKTPIAEKWGADHMVFDGTMLYYLSVQTNAVALVNAFDLTTRTVKWQTPIGPSGSYGYSMLAQDVNQLYVKGGNGYMNAINKITGVTAWSQQGYATATCANNMVYSYKADYKIYGLNSATGAVLVQCTPNLGFGTSPYVDGGAIYVTGVTPATPTSINFVASYNAQTGVENWRKNLTGYYERPVVAGAKIYAVHQESSVTNYIYTLISFDVNSGTVKDSILIPARRIGSVEIINTADKKLFSAH